MSVSLIILAATLKHLIYTEKSNIIRIMDRMITVVVALIAAAGIPAMIYSEQRKLALVGNFRRCGVGFACGVTDI
jgi:hypothetical protein